MKKINKEVPNKYRSFPFWSWNDELDENELVNQINWMHDNGIGGFFMHARGGLTTPYLGEKWFSCVRVCLKRAKELNMEAYAYDENGWPSGFAGGKLLENEKDRDCYLVASFGEYDPNADVSYDISNDKLVRVMDGKNNLNIYIKVSTSTADVCNKEVVKKFIELTHEQYKKNDIYGNLKGFFTDEPQYYRRGTPYTTVLPNYFKEQYNEDIFDRLGLLFVEKEGYRDFRYKFYLSMQHLLLNAFSKQIYGWCNENGYKLTGHYVEENTIGEQIMCCGGVMPFYEYEHIPGCDWLGRNIKTDLNPKQLGSVAAQLGKKQVMSEMFACAGWDATPLELKHIAEFLMVHGVNNICQHLLPYSEHGQRKRDYPEHYSKINPWVEKDFKSFNDYFAIIGQHLSKSTEIVNVGVLHPLRSAYFDYKDSLSATGFGIKELDDSLAADIEMLGSKHIPYHFIDETILAKHGSIKNNKFIVGECSYDFIVLPSKILTLGKETEILLKKYVSNGGKILILGNKPEYLEGNTHNYDYLTNNTTLDEIICSLDFSSKENRNLRISYLKDEKGNPYFYVVNLGDETDLELHYKNFKTFSRERDDNETILSNTIHFNRYESMILYPSNKDVTANTELEILELTNDFDVTSKVDNFLTLDFFSFSKDGINYSKPLYCMAAFDRLLKERYQGDLYLKYEFNIKDIPNRCIALIEDMHNIEVRINNVAINKKDHILEKDLWTYDIQKALKKGKNSLIVHINFYESDDVYYALFGENVLESIKNCLAYPTTLEAAYLMGDFGVEGDYVDGKNNNIIIANNFEIIKQPTHIKHLIKDGFPFFRGNISLEQIINVKNTNKLLVIKDRFQMVDVYVNDVFVKRLMFDYKLDLSKHLRIGDNKIKLILTVSNRNLLGILHGNEEEPLFVGPSTFERFKSWNDDGESSRFKRRYSFVKTII